MTTHRRPPTSYKMVTTRFPSHLPTTIMGARHTIRPYLVFKDLSLSYRLCSKRGGFEIRTTRSFSLRGGGGGEWNRKPSTSSGSGICLEVDPPFCDSGLKSGRIRLCQSECLACSLKASLEERQRENTLGLKALSEPSRPGWIPTSPLKGGGETRPRI